MPKSIASEFPSSQHCLFAVQGISQRLFSSTSITTISMHSTSIVKDLHDKSTSTVLLVYQDAIFDTSVYVVESPETVLFLGSFLYVGPLWYQPILAFCIRYAIVAATKATPLFLIIKKYGKIKRFNPAKFQPYVPTRNQPDRPAFFFQKSHY